MQPIYSTTGDWVALLHDDRLYDTYGEWIGWLEDRDVYNRDGFYTGVLSNDGRILRERVQTQRARRPLPPVTPRIRPPATVPLAPLFAELAWKTIDVFEEKPQAFKYISDLRPDWEG